MKLWLLSVVCTTICVALASDEEESLAAKANNQFSVDLLKILLKDGNSQKNVFFSPYSISAALAMTSLGANGNTLREIDDTFHFNAINKNDRIGVHEAYSKLIDLYNGVKPDYTLATANKLFGEKQFELNATFESNAKKYYKAELQQLDFDKGTAEGIINKWVEDQTNNKIKDLFKPRSLSPATQLVLVNAIYFKGDWIRGFSEKLTQKNVPFRLKENQQREVEMMSQVGHFKYGSDANMKAQILELPYKGDQLSMIIILPEEIDGLQDVVKFITGDKLNSLLMQDRDYTKVNVRIPKFKVETEYSLADVLKQLKLEDLFTNNADLSGISNSTKLKVDKVVHKAFVDVNEKGTEAAAVTGIGFVAVSAFIQEPEPVRFVADHPFYFAIVDNTLHTVLFNGLFYSG